MNKSIIIVERIVLESLEKKPLVLSEIKEQTRLNDPLLKAILSQLIERGLVSYKRGMYSVEWNNSEVWKKLASDKESIKVEIKELFSSLVNAIFEKEKNSTLRVQKIWLEPREKEELQRRLKDIDSFIESIKGKRCLAPVSEKTCGKQVLFYGASTYSTLVDGLLKVG